MKYLVDRNNSVSVTRDLLPWLSVSIRPSLTKWGNQYTRVMLEESFDFLVSPAGLGPGSHESVALVSRGVCSLPTTAPWWQ